MLGLRRKEQDEPEIFLYKKERAQRMMEHGQRDTGGGSKPLSWAKSGTVSASPHLTNTWYSQLFKVEPVILDAWQCLIVS